VQPGEVKVIGRNPSCRIRNLRCSRQYLRVSLKSGESELQVEPISKGAKFAVTKFKRSEGELLEGPGFSFQVCLIEVEDQNSDEKRAKRKADEMIDTDEIPKEAKQLKLEREASFERENIPDGWNSYENGSLLVYRHRANEIKTPANRIVAFDFDGTLVDPKSGAKFAKNENDWALKSLSLPSEIRKLHDNGSAFVIFSNQNGIGSGRADATSIKGRFAQVCQKIDVPCFAILATEDDHNRKPRNGMWNFFVTSLNKGEVPDLHRSFYVGDALGRPKSKLQTSDHSAADLLFAFNIGLPVLSPEQFIAGKRDGKVYQNASEMSAFRLPKFIPPAMESKMNVSKAGHFLKSKEEKIEFASYALLIEHLRETFNSNAIGGLVVLSGIPATGKSTFYRRHLSPHFESIERDLIGPLPKCDQTIREKVAAAKAKKQASLICVDCTNPDKESRKHWIKLGKSLDLMVACVQFSGDVDRCLHQEAFRRVYRGPDSHPQQGKLKVVPTVAMRTAQSRFQTLSTEEGFDAAYQLEFVPEFDNDQQKSEYFMFLKDH
jgi:bifunctional polynucleotide phosphatase/kinase